MTTLSPIHERTKIKKKKLLARLLGIILFLIALILLLGGNDINIQLDIIDITTYSDRESAEESNPLVTLRRIHESAKYEKTSTAIRLTQSKDLESDEDISEETSTKAVIELQETPTEIVQTTASTQTSEPQAMNSSPTRRSQVSTFETPSAPLTSQTEAIPIDYNGTNSFAACFMWMDDTERLVEWIAYHYHTLPLRHLILYRDPKSKRNLARLVDKWRPYMKITVWTSPDDFPYYPVNLDEREDNVNVYTQKRFIRNCMKQLQEEHWTWTFVGDPDEFLVLNSKAVPNSAQLMKRPGIIMEILKGARATQRIPHTNTNLIKKQLHRWGDPTAVPCMCLSRKQFAAFESPHEAVLKDVPTTSSSSRTSHVLFDPYRFQTLRFRHHRRKGIICKSIVDVSGVEINATVYVTHHRVVEGCGDRWGRQEDLMHVHHHLGSWELYQRPNDYRGGQLRGEAFHKKNEWVLGSLRSDHGDETRQWLGGFVEHFGEKKAVELLAGVGFPYNHETALERIVAGTRNPDGSPSLIVRPSNITEENEKMSEFEKSLAGAKGETTE